MLKRIQPQLVIGLLMTLALFSSFGFALAQANDESLEATIRAAVLSDPRSQDMTPAEIDAMVAALSRQAQSVGMTSDDIIWRPAPTDGEATGTATTQACDGFLCSLNHAFGFDGSDYTIPIWLGACALMLIFLIGGVMEYHHLHKRKLAREHQGM